MFQHEVPKEYKATFVKLYKMCHFTIEAMSFLYYIQYMTGRNDTHSLFLKLAGVALVYSLEEPADKICLKLVLKDILSGNWRYYFYSLN